MTRNIVKSLRFSAEELEMIKHYAQRCGLSAAGYIRKCALKYRPRGKDMTKLISEIARQGGLLKHLHTQGLGHSEKTSQLLQQMQKTIKVIEHVVSTKETDEKEKEAMP